VNALAAAARNRLRERAQEYPLSTVADIPGCNHHGVMIRCFAFSLVALVLLCSKPVSAAPQVGATQPAAEPGPPEDMIDFLGRRRECSKLAPEPGEALPAPRPGSWREWLRCGTLAAEEVELRRRYRNDARALRYLDQAPSAFALDAIVAYTYDGPPPALVERSEQRGVAADGRVAWRMILDRKAAGGRATAVTVSWGNHASRTIYLDNRMFPWLALTSAWVAVKERPQEEFIVEMRYGFVRGWCGDVDRDDRGRVSVYFKPEGVEVFRQDPTNCNASYQELARGAFAAPPAARRR
jgi:hypothetical protein